MPNWNVSSTSGNWNQYDAGRYMGDSAGRELSVRTTNSFIGDDVSGVELALQLGGEYIVAQGTARRCSEDKPDSEVAELYAYGRALQRLAKRLIKEADGKVKHKDDLRNRRVQDSKTRFSRPVQSATTAGVFDSLVGKDFSLDMERHRYAYRLNGVKRVMGNRVVLNITSGFSGQTFDWDAPLGYRIEYVDNGVARLVRPLN